MNDAGVLSPVETSVIIRAFNESKYLPGLFDALERQRYRAFETIVVDSGSNDGTLKIAEARADRVIRISSHDFTFGYSLNVGIGAARGSMIVIVSAHTEPCDDGWLESLIAPLKDNQVAMVYGGQIGVPSSRFGEFEDFRRIYGPQARDDSISDIRANNANSAIRRDLWEEMPFDATLTGLEDISWARHWISHGYKVRYVPQAAVHHIHEESWRQIRRRYYREAVAARRIGIRSRKNAIGVTFRALCAMAKDICVAAIGKENKVLRRLTRAQCMREAVYYHLHKIFGTVGGLLATHPMQTRREMESFFFDRTMRAVVVQERGKARLCDVPLPAIKPGDVLIKVANVAVCTTDLEIFEGALGYYSNGMAQYPIIPGHEFSGRLVACGQNVDWLKENQPVVVECIQSCHQCSACRAGNYIGCEHRAELGVMGRDGAYADYVVVPAQFVHPLPSDADLRAAALVEPLAVVNKGLRRLNTVIAGRPPGQRYAVIGCGPLGQLCAKVLAARGERVSAFDRNRARLGSFAGTGICTYNSLDALDEHDIFIEATGNPEALDAVLRMSPANAAILLLGLPYGERSFSFETIAAYDKTIIGSVGSTAEDFEAAIGLLPTLDLSAHLDCTLPLTEFEKAWRTVRNGEALKVILQP